MERSGDSANDLVLLGKVTKPHGIKGEVKVYPYSREPGSFIQYSRVLLGSSSNAIPVEYRIERARIQNNLVLLQLEGCDNRNDAEGLVNSLVYVHENELPEPDEDEFYLRDLEGRKMVTDQGQTIGIVSDILINGSQDLLKVTDGKQEYIIPLVPEFLVSIDENEVRVSLPPGLLEIN